MSDRYYITQYLGNLTIMERINHDYAKTRKVVTIYTNDEALAQYILERLNHET